MISKLARLPVVLAFGPALNSHDAGRDIPSKNFRETARIGLVDDNETGWDRVVKMFSTDDYGRMSQELNSIYQATFFGMFSGAVYGGFLGSRKSYMDFMERNQATAFESHLDAKRKLQDQVTMGFAKNAFRFSWRLALFSASYTGVSTAIAVYRGKSSMFEYIAAGAFTGALYKFNLGLRGMTAGLLVGGGLGTVAGGVTLLLLKSSGMTMEEARYWQYKWRAQRDDAINEGYKTQLIGTEHDDPLINEYDSRHGTGKLDLKLVDLGEEIAEPAKVTEVKAPEAQKK